MNKDKLISLIIRKQTYKDTKPYLNELGIGKENAAKISAEAVRDILTTDYIAEAKLYAVRYLKDAFQKGNPHFITLVETSILPILMNIAADEADDKAVTKYAGSSYTKTQQLSKFKSILSSLFRIAKECIRKWAEWIPDANKRFNKALIELKNKKVQLNFDYKYFREENEQYFKQHCLKNGVKLAENPPTTSKSKGPNNNNKKKDPLQDAVQSALAKVDKARNAEELAKLQNDFNEALNSYLQNAVDFKEELVQKWFDEIQNKKRNASQRLEDKKQVQKANNFSSTPAGTTPTGAKSNQRISNEESKNASQKNKIIRKQENNGSEKNKNNNSKLPESKKGLSSVGSQKVEQEAKSQKKVGFSEQPKIVIKSPKQSNKERGSPKMSLNISQQKQQTELLQQKKFPKESKPLPKGPLVFDDIQEQFFKPPQPANKSQKTSQHFERSKPQMSENRPIKPTGQESRSPKATEISKSSRQIEQSKSSKVSSDVKTRQRPKQEVKQPISFSQKQIVKVGNVLNDISISKEESRIQFSQEEQSEYSEESPQQDGQNARNFKKQKPNLASIEEENYSNISQNKSGLAIPPVRSRISEQKASVANKLLQQNKQLYQKINKMSKDYENQKQARVSLARQRQQIQKQLLMRRDSQQRVIRKLKASVPIQDYNLLKRQLERQRETQSKLYEQNARLRASHQTLIEQLNETKQKLQNLSLQERSRVAVGTSSHFQAGIDRSLKQKSQLVGKNLLGSRILKEQVDQDYIGNSTHHSNMHNWLSDVNIALFKRNVLNLSDIFYRDQYLTILSKSSVYTQNDKQFLSLAFTFQFKSIKQISPAIRYKNCQELDLWTKPLTGDQLLYTQELVVGLHSHPIKILKGQLKIIQGLVIKFLLPFMYVNFLREEAFSTQQFQQIFMMKAQHLLKSKIVVTNKNTIKQVEDFKRIFKSAQISVDNKIRFCLSEGISDCIFMIQIEMLRNNKAILRILPIPATEQMNIKARELLDDLVFLIS